MALSFRAVQKAYVVFNEIKKNHLPDLGIGAWPEDLSRSDKKDRRRQKQVYGCDRKADDGWESIFFWVENPTKALIFDFERLKSTVPNSSISRYDEEAGMWKFGWF